jgi:hypothetical protein
MVLVELKKMGTERPTKKMVSSLTKYPMHSLCTLLLNLRKKGHVEYDKDTVQVTPAGEQAAPSGSGSNLSGEMTNEAAQNNLKDLYGFKGKSVAIMDLLSDGKAHDPDEVMHAIGCTNKKSFGTYLSSLRSSSVVENVNGPSGQDKWIHLSDKCFPFQRPC